MAARYQRIAEDLARRIAAGEWHIGDVLPPISQLQEQYDGCALNTIRAAQQLLVDDGIIETISGRGAYVLRQPDLDTSREEAKRQLAIVRDAASDALRALNASGPTQPEPATEVASGYDDLTKTWGYMQSTRCDTCDQEIGGVTRGWVEVENEVDLYLPVGHDSHDVITYFGAVASEDQDLALRRELWWERNAHLERAAELLLSGEYEAAGAHAERAGQILVDDPDVDQFGVQLLAPAEDPGPRGPFIGGGL